MATLHSPRPADITLPTASYNFGTHPTLFQIDWQPGDFNSSLKAVRAFRTGDVICPFEGLTSGPKRYTSVQCGPGPEDHVELNSDLVYVNHSCEPNVAFDLSSPRSNEWHVRALKNISPGEPLSFFYPSTEWEMVQPFRCNCNTETCLGEVRGAFAMTSDQLRERGFINDYIWKKVQERDE
ncbi:hypothetical protein FRC04_012056 [Tulasnella sp. 424]|nr:hypothetical protein FRC04_012056 [Tulasnella sp. 424]KAG8975814.1 hypothetical protein FRC05_005024 [Tulasnella sp. 425]